VVEVVEVAGGDVVVVGRAVEPVTLWAEFELEHALSTPPSATTPTSAATMPCRRPFTAR
jgi:hypothetical protein